MASPPRPELPLKFSLRGIPTNRSQLRPVLVPSELRSWLARLQLARADAIQGDTGKAKAAYQDFLTLWKDADPIFPSSSLRRPNTQNYSRSLLKFCDQVLPAPGKWLTRTCARHRPQKDWLSGLGIVFLLAKNDAGWKVETSRIVWLS